MLKWPNVLNTSFKPHWVKKKTVIVCLPALFDCFDCSIFEVVHNVREKQNFIARQCGLQIEAKFSYLTFLKCLLYRVVIFSTL